MDSGDSTRDRELSQGFKGGMQDLGVRKALWTCGSLL